MERSDWHLGASDSGQEVLRQAAGKMLSEDSPDPLQVEILANLARGPRSVAELVEEIYGVAKGGSGYMTYYTRSRRALARLASRGYVSRRVFGSTKPYRLTGFAFDNLASHAIGRNPPDILPPADRAIHVTTIVIAILVVLSLSDRIQVGRFLLSVINSIFFFALGVSAAMIARGLRRVF